VLIASIRSFNAELTAPIALIVSASAISRYR
jgi:hypothetical protein